MTPSSMGTLRLRVTTIAWVSAGGKCINQQRTQKTIIQPHSTSGELFGWPFERNDRNFAGRLLLISGIGRKDFYCSLKRLFSLIAAENPGRGLKFLTANLDRHFRMSQQVEIPLGMFRMASFGRDCKEAITIGHQHQGS